MIIFVKNMKNLILCFLSPFLSAFLFSMAWPVDGFSFLIFLAFVPLLFIAKNLKKSLFFCNLPSIYLNILFFSLSFLAFFIFNMATTYWIYYATLFGAIMAFLINSLLMSFVMYLFFKANTILGKRLGYLAFIVFWLSMEYLHLNWDLSWPWLTIGNCFSESLFLINWYEYTGVLGGTLWVLIINILVFEVLDNKNKAKSSIMLSVFILVPFLLSQYLASTSDNKKLDYINTVIVQPNIDPYSEKFNIPYHTQLSDLIALARTKLDSNTELLVGPETGLLEGRLWESKIEFSYSIQELRRLQSDYPKLGIIIGATTYKLLKSDSEKSSTARHFNNQHEEFWYDAYNSAIFLSNEGEVSIYHKTKLVPGAEKIPFPSILNSISALSIDLGGVSGSLGSDNNINTFNASKTNILPLICYESIYGDLNTSKIFDLICIITNDGWWGNSSGYKQHFSYAKLRAIEQKRSIIRCANTGQSGFITYKGEVQEMVDWDEKKAIASPISLCKEITFYNQYGDYIGRLASFISAIFILMMFVKTKIK
jgi:apolipoprotein N-acyltransferase